MTLSGAFRMVISWPRIVRVIHMVKNIGQLAQPTRRQTFFLPECSKNGFSFLFRKGETCLLKVSELLRGREALGFLLPFLDKNL